MKNRRVALLFGLACVLFFSRAIVYGGVESAIEQITYKYQSANWQQNYKLSVRPSESPIYQTFQAGDYNRVIAECRDGLSKEPTNTNLLELSAAAYAELTNWPAAIEGCAVWTNLYPSSPRAVTALACAYLDAHHPELALPTFNEAIDQQPTNSNLHLGAGLALYALNDPAGALMDFDDAAQLGEISFELFLVRGMACARLHHLTDAQNDLNHALQLSPTNPVAGEWLTAVQTDLHNGSANFDRNNHDKFTADLFTGGYANLVHSNYTIAISNLTTAIALTNKNAICYAMRSWAYYALSNFPAAQADLQTAAKREVIDPPNYRFIALTAEHEKKFPIVLKVCKKGFSQNLTNDYTLLLFAGRAYFWTGEYENAVKYFEAALATQPGDYRVYNNYAWMLAVCPKKKYQNGPIAVELGKIACERTEQTNSSCLNTLAAAYARIGDFKTALQYQSNSIAMAGANSAQAARLEQMTASLQAGKPFTVKPSADPGAIQ